MTQTVLAIGAHPDDVEFMAAGALALLRQKGWEVHTASLTPGDCGTMTRTREEIGRIRRAEGAAAANLLGGTYHCLECDDMFILYDRPTLLKVIGLIRRVRPDLVFAPSPDDYMADHENTSRLVWSACFAAGIPNIPTPGDEPFHRIPCLYYMDPVDAKDKFGMPTPADAMVDISGILDLKTRMLACHASQRDWLLAHHGVDEYLDAMKRHGRLRGRQAGCEFAEAFRQHRGHSFPQDNWLSKELGDLVRTAR
jgi:LmbE family N-acetylglucosaminyl deacetylase